MKGDIETEPESETDTTYTDITYLMDDKRETEKTSCTIEPNFYHYKNTSENVYRMKPLRIPPLSILDLGLYITIPSSF